MPLVVVHRHHAIELAVARPLQQRVGGKGPLGVDSRPNRPRNGRGNQSGLLVTKQPVFTRMRVERADSNPHRPTTPRSHHPRHEPRQQADRRLDPLHGKQTRHTRNRRMQRDMRHPQPLLRPYRHPRRQVEHHRAVAHATFMSQNFRMAGEINPPRTQRILVERRGDDRLDLLRQRHPRRRHQPVISRPTRPRGHLPRRQIIHPHRRRIPADDRRVVATLRHELSTRELIRRRNLHHLRARSHERQRPSQHLRASHHHRPAPRGQIARRQTASDRLGTNPRDIAHRDRQPGE